MTSVYSNYSSFIFNLVKTMQKKGVSEREAKLTVLKEGIDEENLSSDALSYSEIDKPIDYETLMNTFLSSVNFSQNNNSYVFDKDNKTQTIKIGNKEIVVTANVSGNNSIQIFVDKDGKISVFNDGGNKISFLNADKDTNLDINIVESENKLDIVGGHGNNTIVVQENAVVGNIFGQEGNDIIVNAGSAIFIDGNDGNDIILNSGSAQYIDGWNGNDIIYNNGTVNRYIWGYTGDDKIINDKNGKVKKIMDESDNDRILNYGSARIKKGKGSDVIINKKTVEFSDGSKLNLNENETAYFDDDGNVVVFNEEDNISKIYSASGQVVILKIGDTYIPYTYKSEVIKNEDGTYTINHTNFIPKDDENFDEYKFTTQYSRDGNLLKAQFGDNVFESRGKATLCANEDCGYTIIDKVSTDDGKSNQFAYIYSPYGVLENQISLENNTITFKDADKEISNVELSDNETARINPDGTVTVFTNDVDEVYNVTYSKDGVAIETSKEIKIAESVDDENGNPTTQWNTLTFENLLDNEMVLIGSDGLPLSNLTKQEPYLVYDRKTDEIKTDFPLSSDGEYFYMQNPDYKLDNINALLISGQAMCVTEDFSLFLSQHYNADEQKYYYTDEAGQVSVKSFNEMKAIWEAANPNRVSVVDWETDEIFNPEIVDEDSLSETETSEAAASSLPSTPKDVIADSRNKTICEFLGWSTDKNITNAQYDENGNIKSFSSDNKDYTVTTNAQGKITSLTVKSNNTVVQKINCSYTSAGVLKNKYEYNYDENGVKTSYLATSFNTNGTKADEITYTYNEGKLANYRKKLFDLEGNLLYTREKSYIDSEGKISSKIISDKITSANYGIEDNCLSTYPCIYSFNSTKCTLKFQGGKTITFKDNENVLINIDGTVTVTDKDGKVTKYNRRGFPI